MTRLNSLRTRTEMDSLGTLDVPAHAYWGIHTGRAMANFQLTSHRVAEQRFLIEALAHVKWAAARANQVVGALDPDRAALIGEACRRVAAGDFDDQFPLDMIQGGAGTSTNMNANEVIANVALEMAGRPFGDYQWLHPNDHVNLGQSTNDVYPTAVRLAMVKAGHLLSADLAHLATAFARKAGEFAGLLKVGRTQLQDAVPMTLGQEFGAYCDTCREDIERLKEASDLLLEINLGATAIGTGINTAPGYGAHVLRELAEITGLPVVRAANLVEATSDCGAFITFSGTLRRTAVKLSKICNDLRLLSSGPRAGLGEIRLPAMQAGSSIMPGKVNPVIPEAVNQVAFEVIGHDLTVTLAAEAGQLQLNAFEPVIAYSILQSISHLSRAAVMLADLCIDGIEADREVLRREVEESVGLATALNTRIGYARASALAKEAVATGRSIAELAVAQGVLTQSELAETLSPARLITPGS